MPLLIRGPRLAFVLLLLTAWIAVRGLWNLSPRLPAASNWAFSNLPFNFPIWLTVALNLLFYGILTLLLVEALVDMRGAERLLVATWIAEVVIVPVRQYLPAPEAIAAVWLQEFGNLVMFLAAVALWLQIREMASQEPQLAPPNDA